MISACLPLSRKYSPIAVAAKGARYCIGAGSEAVAATTMVYAIAPNFFERLHNLRNRRTLLANRAVDADEVVLRRVDDGVERDGGLAGLAVADEQLALSAADGNHRVDGLDAGRHRLGNALPRDDARSETLDGKAMRRVDGALVVDGLAERVHDAADQRLANGNVHDAAGALDLVALADLGVVAQQHGADLVLLEVHREAGDAVRKLDQLAGHHLVEAMHARDTVAERDDRADLVDLDALLVVLDAALEQFGNLVCLNLCHAVPFSL